MSHLQSSKQIAKTSLLCAGLALALIVALPLLVGLAYAARFLIPLAIVALVVGLACNSTVRRWFAEEEDDSRDYRGIALPAAGLQAHPGHAWASRRASSALVGADALALAALGEVSSIEPPEVGAKVAQGQTLFTLRRGGRRLQVKAPVSGVVAAINGELVKAPAALSRSAYDQGWIVQLEKVRASEQTTRLLTGQPLRRWFRAEVDRLMTLVAPAGGTAVTMADGGKLASDLAHQIDDRVWAEIAAQLFENPRT